MFLNISIIFFLMFLNFVIAEDTINKDSLDVAQVFLIIGIILASAITAFSLIVFIYFILKFIKRKISESHYYIDDISSNKDGGKYNSETNNLYAELPHINQIRPSLNIRYIISTIRQCLADLCYSLIPLSWLHIEHIDNPEKPVNEKMDLRI